MPELTIESTDQLDWAVKKFKRMMLTAGIFQELRRRRHYVKPSAARILKTKAAKRARDKAARRRRSSD
jgi:small subunit ribosomal protein S21